MDFLKLKMSIIYQALFFFHLRNHNILRILQVVTFFHMKLLFLGVTKIDVQSWTRTKSIARWTNHHLERKKQATQIWLQIMLGNDLPMLRRSNTILRNVKQSLQENKISPVHLLQTKFPFKNAIHIILHHQMWHTKEPSPLLAYCLASSEENFTLAFFCMRIGISSLVMLPCCCID